MVEINKENNIKQDKVVFQTQWQQVNNEFATLRSNFLQYLSLARKTNNSVPDSLEGCNTSILNMVLIIKPLLEKGLPPELDKDLESLQDLYNNYVIKLTLEGWKPIELQDWAIDLCKQYDSFYEKFMRLCKGIGMYINTKEENENNSPSLRIGRF